MERERAVMKKKILHVVGGMDIGGTETMLMNLYRNIDREKYEFHFISYYDREGFYDKEIENLGGKIIHLNHSNKIGSLSSILKLKKIMQQYKYEVVHTHTLFNCGIGILAAKLGGVKTRVSHAHTIAEESSNYIKRFYIKLMRIIINCCSTDFLACSNKAGEFLFGKEIIKDNRYRFLPNYVDYRKFVNNTSRGEVREALKIKSNEFVIGHVGRLMSAKNHSFILDILKEMKGRGIKVKAIFVGDGNLRTEIENKAKKLNLEKDLIITGMVKNTEWYMKAMDTFILPSFYEGFGLVLLEAQAMSLPCVVSQGIQPEVDLEVGLIKKLNLSQGVKVWSREIENTLNNRRNLNKNMIEKSFNEKGYSLEKILEKLNTVYEGRG